MPWVTLGLCAILFLVLLLPFAVKHVEESLEAFFLVMGAAAITLSGGWTGALLRQALTAPLALSAAVLVAGFAFRALRPRLRAWARVALERWGLPALSFTVVLLLGLGSALVTSIVAALVLAELVSALELRRQAELRLVILSCYSIGIGAVLTPLGGPLTAIAVERLQGAPYFADFFFLARLLGRWVLPLLLFLGAAASFLVPRAGKGGAALAQDHAEGPRDIAYRAMKVYAFMVGLVLLAEAFGPLTSSHLAPVPTLGLYWVNALSAVLDNATLAAAEIGPQLPLERIHALLLGLLIAGGMLIPGNLPNIICASKLRLSSRDWAAFALPLGAVLMAGVFILLWLR